MLIRCSLIEVTQQSKARHKDDFLVAFSPVVAEAMATAYKGAPAEIQAKLRRVVDVWRDRNIFEQPIQAAVEARMDGKNLLSLRTSLLANIIPQNSTSRAVLLGAVDSEGQSSGRLHLFLRSSRS